MASSKIMPNGREINVPAGQFIVSKTDANSRIRYANRVFMAVSGFSEAQIQGQSHNLIRHPDMPKGVFQKMWDQLKLGQEFLGFVKNLCANGDYYWVYAHVVIERDAAGQSVGYSSFQRRMPANIVREVEAVYAEMRQIEAQAGSQDAGARSLAWLEQFLQNKEMGYGQWVHMLYRRES